MSKLKFERRDPAPPKRPLITLADLATGEVFRDLWTLPYVFYVKMLSDGKGGPQRAFCLNMQDVTELPYDMLVMRVDATLIYADAPSDINA